ncbi:hypothetical protein QCE63_24595 [Caballeronia sp. LZ065]|uniref:hypothetical protein n=1 Tax=Caballeronia sp. LZ065 TaxID=3038571 RepID=UPI0028673AC1|nr:hypothetical protein [Caballeronia sp. LZ065]MDR5782588.1 hypothetical protein [Caballeronia sp. LZ065]
MKRVDLVSCFLAAASACTLSTAHAGGYGPAPFYRPETGAPASERGISTQTLAAEQAQHRAWGAEDVGGSRDDQSQAGYRLPSPFDRSLFRHH